MHQQHNNLQHKFEKQNAERLKLLSYCEGKARNNPICNAEKEVMNTERSVKFSAVRNGEENSLALCKVVKRHYPDATQEILNCWLSRIEKTKVLPVLPNTYLQLVTGAPLTGIFTLTEGLLVFLKSKQIDEATINLLKENARIEEINLKKKYLLEFACVEGLFMKVSWFCKQQFLEVLLEEIKNLETLALLSDSLYFAREKISIYARSLTDTDFVFDKVPLDHCRMMRCTTLIENDKNFQLARNWFKSLKTAEQVALLINLTRKGGGATEMVMGRVIEKRYLKLSSENSQKPTLGGKSLTSIHRSKSATSMLPEKKKRNRKMRTPKQSSEIASLRSATYDIECEAQRKIWQVAINKYRKEVEKRHIKEKPDETGKKNKKKKSKGDKKSSDKDKKNKKGKKSNKSKKKSGDEGVDWVQLLPISVVKKIFSYLDQRTLKKAKAVDEYWNYVITDILKERKARKSLNKTIKKLQKGVDLNFEPITPQNSKPEKDKPRITWTEKRINDCLKKCAARKFLGSERREGELVEKSILNSAMSERAADYVCPVQETTTYPRIATGGEKPFYVPEYILKDVDLIYENSTDCSKHSESSFLYRKSIYTRTTSSMPSESTNNTTSRMSEHDCLKLK